MRLIRRASLAQAERILVAVPPTPLFLAQLPMLFNGLLPELVWGYVEARLARFAVILS